MARPEHELQPGLPTTYKEAIDMVKVPRLLVVLVACAAVSLPLTVGASTKPTKTVASYQLKPHTRCNAGYVRTHGKKRINGHLRSVVLCKLVVHTPPHDPPTVVTVTASANPALPGASITYTIQVADVLAATTGQIQVTVDGVAVAGCYPILNPILGGGALTGTCQTTAPPEGTHLVVGIFTGDAVFAQSAGALTEVVSLAPITTVPSVPAYPTSITVTYATSAYFNQVSGRDCVPGFDITGTFQISGWNDSLPNHLTLDILGNVVQIHDDGQADGTGWWGLAVQHYHGPDIVWTNPYGLPTSSFNMPVSFSGLTTNKLVLLGSSSSSQGIVPARSGRNCG